MNGLARTSSYSLALFLLSCSGGGGGGGVAGDLLTGTLTLPSLGSDGSYGETRQNDDAHHAEAAGTLVVGTTHRVFGHVHPKSDQLDVFRIRTSGSVRVSVDLRGEQALKAHVFEIATGREVIHLDNGQGKTLNLPAGEFDIVIASSEKATDYIVSLRTATADGDEFDLPLAANAVTHHSAAQARYLGAHHAMRAGEIVVMRDVNGPDSALAIPGCVRLSGGKGPIELYNVVGPQIARSIDQGATLAQSLELTTALLAKSVESMPGVRAASPNLLYHTLATEPNDPLYARQWHYKQIKLPLAWDITTGSASVIVGVVDTGMVLGHPDFAGRLIAGVDMISNVASALDGDGRDSNPDDPGTGGGSVPSSFHGSHVGGTIGAKSNNSLGCAGVDWNCKLMPIRVLGKGGSGSLQDIADGVLYGARLQNSSGALPPQRCHVMNMSLGGPGSTTVLGKACADASAAGVILIAASGNDNKSTMNYPASYPSVISVGSTDFVRARAPYSNFASNIDIWAPGGNQRVDLNADGAGDGVLSISATGFNTTRKATYAYLQGTSMASPHVAGVAALMLAVKPAMTTSEFRAIIVSSSQSGSNLPNSGVLIDAHAAVLAAKSGGPSTPILVATPNAVSLDANTTAKSIALTNKGTGTLTYEPTKSSFTYKSGTGWLAASVIAGGTNITHNALNVTVNPIGQADGKYEALVTLVFSSASVDYTALITVVMTVGATSQKSETIFVLLVDFDTLDSKVQATTTATQNYLFSMAAVGVGSYLLVAGTDRDNDGFIGDAGELFGLWPSLDSPLTIDATGAGVVRNGFDFDLGEITALKVGEPRRKYRVLPH